MVVVWRNTVDVNGTPLVKRALPKILKVDLHYATSNFTAIIIYVTSVITK